MTAALLQLGQHVGFELAGLHIAVIGVGQVGGRVVQRAEALGMIPLLNDPPLELATKDPSYQALDQILPQADIVTLHVPLVQKPPFPTLHLADCHFFERIKAGCVFVNAARGEAMDTDSLLYAMEHGAVSHAILDVWEQEPMISKTLLEKAAIGTPHIAGYSFEGRLNGTRAVYKEACHFFECEARWTPDSRIFPPPPQIHADARGRSDEAVLCDIISQAYSVEIDDHHLRSALNADADTWARHFTSLRRSYPPRREFTSMTVRVEHATPDLLEKIAAQGFRIAAF